MPVFFAIIDVRVAVILEVALRTEQTIVKPAPLNVVELTGKRIPLRRRRRRRGFSVFLASPAAGQMLHRPVVSAPESIAERIALLRWQMGMAKGLMIIHIGVAVHLEIPARSFNSLMKPLPLNVI